MLEWLGKIENSNIYDEEKIIFIYLFIASLMKILLNNLHINLHWFLCIRYTYISLYTKTDQLILSNINITAYMIKYNHSYLNGMLTAMLKISLSKVKALTGRKLFKYIENNDRNIVMNKKTHSYCTSLKRDDIL